MSNLKFISWQRYEDTLGKTHFNGANNFSKKEYVHLIYPGYLLLHALGYQINLDNVPRECIQRNLAELRAILEKVVGCINTNP